VSCKTDLAGGAQVDDPSTVEVVAGVLGDVMDVTEDDLLHIGCDEITPRCWGGKDRAARLFQDYALKLQQAVTQRGAETMGTKGQKMMT
jgi:N-acetyl-beta-hexosaminidase